MALERCIEILRDKEELVRRIADCLLTNKTIEETELNRFYKNK